MVSPGTDHRPVSFTQVVREAPLALIKRPHSGQSTLDDPSMAKAKAVSDLDYEGLPWLKR